MTLPETPSPWSLADLFPGHDTPEMKKAFADLETLVADFETLRPQLAAQMPVEAFMDAVQRMDAIAHLMNRIYSFAGLAFSADTQDPAIQTFMGNVEQAMAVLQNRLLFFSLWWKDLQDADAARLMDASGDYRYWLEEMRHFKPHTLSEPEEQIINLKNVTGANAINNLYQMITNRYTFKLTVNGEPKELTRGELMVYVRQSDPALRAAAYQALYRVYGEDNAILGQMYQALVRDWKNENVDLRHFSNPLAARNLQNDIPDDVVDTLLDVARSNAAVYQRFFQLKARRLGMDKLRRYDIYAPVAAADKPYPFGEGTRMVLDSFARFDPRLAELAQRVIDHNHLDSQVRKGKRSGAFCASIVPGLTPWVLVNYQDKADDVATLAHELGHAIHSMLAEKHTVFTFHSSLPLAETASTFGEMMVVDSLLAAETDENVRRVLLFRQMDDSYATIMRQSFFALFERTAHKMIADGASVDDLAAAYMENLTGQFGDAVEVADEFRWEWVSIPHFYETPFYVYAYAFGQLLVLSLYQQFKLEGESFKPRYLKILSAGGSDAPERVLAAAGIDIHSPAFWQGGFDVLHRLVDSLETL